MAHSDDLQFYFSKSTAVADDESGYDHKGGRISADQPVFLRARPLASVTGVVITKVQGKNTPGVGTIIYTNTGTTLAWQAPIDSSAGTPVNVGAGGTFELESATGDAWIEVTVTAGDLPSQDTSERVSLDYYMNVLFDDVSLNEAMQGTPNYRCFFVKNTGAGTLKEVHPKIELVAAYTAVKASTFYPPSGAARIELTSAENWPMSAYVRNMRTREIMHYTARGGGNGRQLQVPSEGRRARSTASGEGYSGDSIELVAPIDIFVESYVPASGAASIVQDDLPPAGASFWYPNPTDFVQYHSEFTLAPNAILTVWLRRNVIPGAVEAVGVEYRLSFQHQT